MKDLHLPPLLLRTVAQFGDKGKAWRSALPGTIVRLEAIWNVVVQDPFPMSGVSFTAPAVRADGMRFVVKIPIPHREAEDEPDALRAWNGECAVSLIELDASCAMLLEWCDPGTPLAQGAEPGAVAEIGGDLLRRLQRPPPPDHSFDSLSDVMNEWAAITRERVRTIGDPADIKLVDEGAELMEALPLESDSSVLLHGDYHHWNILASTREPWLVIDPKPMVGDPVYDAAQFIANRYVPGGDPDVFRGEVERFASCARFEVERVLRWCFAREVESTMWELSVGDKPESGRSTDYARLLKGLIEGGRR